MNFICMHNIGCTQAHNPSNGCYGNSCPTMSFCCLNKLLCCSWLDMWEFLSSFSFFNRPLFLQWRRFFRR